MGIAYNTSIVRNSLMVYFDAANKKCYPGTGLAFTNLANYSDITSGEILGDTANYGSVVDGVIELGGDVGNTTSGAYFAGYGDIATSVNGDFTSGAWMLQTSSGSPEILSYRQNSRRLSTYITTNGIYFVQRRTVDPFDSVSTGVSVSNPLNEWGFFCVVKNGTSWSFYKNGDLVGTTTFSLIETVTASSVFHSGIAWTDDDYLSNTLDGRIGPIFHYNRALSAEEIQVNFNAHRGRFGV